MGPYGSQKSLQRYQQLLKEWEKARHPSTDARSNIARKGPPTTNRNTPDVTTDTLRLKRLASSPVTITEVIFVYRAHVYEYYKKKRQRDAGGGRH